MPETAAILLRKSINTTEQLVAASIILTRGRKGSQR